MCVCGVERIERKEVCITVKIACWDILCHITLCTVH